MLEFLLPSLPLGVPVPSHAAEYPLPTHWVARTHGPRGGTSELLFRFFEGDPPLDGNLFTLAGLEMWR